jgi:penicillin-binding protein 2
MFNRAVDKQQKESNIQRFRLSLLVAFLIILSGMLILRLAYLQLSQYKRYATLSLKNQMSISPIAPPRGIILDRNGIVLADNIPVYVLEIIPERVNNLDQTLNQLKSLIPSISDDDIDNFKRTRKQHRSYSSIPFKLKLTQEEVAIFASNQYRFPGVSIKARLMRYYPFGEVAAHILGYVGRMNERDLQRIDQSNYRATNFIGKTGIERYYESTLHGQVGYQQVETDVSGRTLRVISKQNPKSGAKLYLTIDAQLQKAAHEAMKGNRGAVVVMSANKGEILALVSAPSFDPNHFVNGISNKNYNALANAPDKPLFNRAVRGLYPPASTVKPFVAIAGLEKGYITPSETIYDPGWYQLPGIQHKFRDWKRRGHGVIGLKKAITVSCDTYFYQLANKMGIASIEDIYMQFGFGQLTHVDLLEETSGIIPSPEWKKRSRGAIWYPGDTLITAIGQGFTLTTPLQLANATVSLGLHGKRFRPHLLDRAIYDDGTNQIYKTMEEYPIQLKDNKIWDIVSEAMKSVVMDKAGTGHRFGRDASYSVAAKTGTAQVFSGDQYEKKHYTDIPEALRDHSLFIAYAPVDHPQVAIAVLVENHFIASAIARKVLDEYFKFNQPIKQTT